ncbi:MAG: hypothetical protein ACKO5E_03450 [bacterium]
MQTIEQDTRFYIAESTIRKAGNGLFAAMDLAAGSRLAVTGVQMKPGSTTDICTAWADEYKIRFDNILVLPTGFAGMINHSSKPNLRKLIENGLYFFVLENAVASGSELFIEYSEYALKRFMQRA